MCVARKAKTSQMHVIFIEVSVSSIQKIFPKGVIKPVGVMCSSANIQVLVHLKFDILFAN